MAGKSSGSTKGRRGLGGGESQRGRGKKDGSGEVHVALLRGINVGGKNMLPMGALVEIFEGAGCTEVRTYINSGNVVFAAGAEVVKRVARVVEGEIEKRFGFRAPVVVRTAEEMARVGERHLLAGESANAKGKAQRDKQGGEGAGLEARGDKSLYVAFLAEEPGAERVGKLDPKRSPGDEFVVRGREVYLRLGNGAGETKLTAAYFDSVLGTVSTFGTGGRWGELVGMCDGG